MNSTDQQTEGSSSGRGGERRQNDRRRTDRRAPVPLWRRPWAYVGYGVGGALLLFIVLSMETDAGEDQTAPEVSTTTAGPAVDSTRPAGAGAPVQDAYGAAGYEQLVAEGEAAVGRRVRAMMFCEPIRSVGLRTGGGIMANQSVAETADAAGRVPAAECAWGDEATAPDLLLIVPPAQAERFASAPEVEQSFVRRRRVRAEVEWIGRSEALALRNVAVLRAID
jgi:hypothetical protein